MSEPVAFTSSIPNTFAPRRSYTYMEFSPSIPSAYFNSPRVGALGRREKSLPLTKTVSYVRRFIGARGVLR